MQNHFLTKHFFVRKVGFSRCKFFIYIFFSEFWDFELIFLRVPIDPNFRHHWIRVVLGCPEPIPVTKNAGDRPQSSVNSDPSAVLGRVVVPGRPVVTVVNLSLTRKNRPSAGKNLAITRRTTD